MALDLRKVRHEMTRPHDLPYKRSTLRKYAARYQGAIRNLERHYNKVLDHTTEKKHDILRVLKSEMEKKKKIASDLDKTTDRLESEIDDTLSYFVAERTMREEAQAEVTDLRATIEQLTEDNARLTEDKEKLRHDIEELCLQINNNLAVGAAKTFSQDGHDHIQKKRKLGEGYKDEKDEQDEKSAAIGEPGICKYWKLNGRCKFGEAGETCVGGYHHPEFSAKLVQRKK
jgi:DNA mismatch repair ATPase MutS